MSIAFQNKKGVDNFYSGKGLQGGEAAIRVLTCSVL
jgi:hypothetical protein